MIAVATAHVTDLVTFLIAVGLMGVPIAAESNPIMAGAWVSGGALAVIVVKLALVGVVLALITRVTTRSRRLPVLVPYALGAAAVASNLVAIVRYG